MQDISRDDYLILNESDVAVHSAEKDMCPTLIYRFQNYSPLSSTITDSSKQLISEDNETRTCEDIKLDDINSVDLFPPHSSTWQQHPVSSNHDLNNHRMFTHKRYDQNSTKLLQGSDDPLISHGADNVLSNDDDHSADFASLITQSNNNHNDINDENSKVKLSKVFVHQLAIPQKPVKSGCSNLTKQQLKVKANLMSARNHQKKQNDSNTISINTNPIPITPIQKQQRTQKTKKKKANTIKLRFHHQALPPEYLSHYEATQGQQSLGSRSQQKISTSLQRTTCKLTNNTQKQTQPRNSNENVRSWLQKIAEIQRTANASKENNVQCQNSLQKLQSQDSNSVVIANETHITTNFMPTDNIQTENKNETHNLLNTSSAMDNDANCILDVIKHRSIRQSLYSDLPYMGEITLDNSKPRRGRKPKKADICHLIYKNYGNILPRKTKIDNHSNYTLGTSFVENQNNTEQPLNLCLRDQLNDSYSVSSGEELSETNSSCPTPVNSPIDYMRDSMLANNLKNSLNNISDLIQEDKLNKPLNKSFTSFTTNNLIKPITVYYQKLLERGMLLNNTNGPLMALRKNNQLSLKIPIPNGFLFPSRKVDKTLSTQIPTNLEYLEQLSTSSPMKSKNFMAPGSQQQLAPQKRKRSAIFIPPMNIENTTNPSNEVSICKFKFTGGSKPTLQEKKMVSVDAGGNYRYFSGTGDKASRRFEYFPRECLQYTDGLLPGVNCTGQKLSIDIPPSSTGLNTNLYKIPESSTPPIVHSDSTFTNVNMMESIISKSPTTGIYEVSKNEACSDSNRENSSYSSSSPTMSPNHYTAQKNNTTLHQLRKSSQREKLEKTFKEQGFLIKTQQLESAEGATYCKFRQLKKFTRYLFRNWKDYLPNDIQQNAKATALISDEKCCPRTSKRVDESEMNQI